MNYSEFKKNVEKTVNDFLGDMDAVHTDDKLSPGEKINAFKEVADKHGIVLDEAITG